MTVPHVVNGTMYEINNFMGVIIVDVVWNGFNEALKIAAMAEVFNVSVAPHSFYGRLSSVMSVPFCAVVPNLWIVEIGVDNVSWVDDFVKVPPQIEDGMFIVPRRLRFT